MLKIFNDLEVFFNDNYRQVHVREYAKDLGISPPTASKRLEQYHKEGILQRTIDKRHHLFAAKRKSTLFQSLLQAYWQHKLTAFIQAVDEQHFNPSVVLFGSAVKAELLAKSDLDIAIFSESKRKINIKSFEKSLGREVQVFQFKTVHDAPEQLKKNILNGKLLLGAW